MLWGDECQVLVQKGSPGSWQQCADGLRGAQGSSLLLVLLPGLGGSACPSLLFLPDPWLVSSRGDPSGVISMVWGGSHGAAWAGISCGTVTGSWKSGQDRECGLANRPDTLET